MYLIKNAVKNIQRSLGKNLLIALIVFVIGFACCLSLSIKQAAISTKEAGLAQLTITANINYDRASQMKDMAPPSENETSKEDMKTLFNQQTLSISELETYATAKSVKAFYYTGNIGLNGNDDLQAITSESNENMPGGMGREMNENSDFTLIGYSDYNAMEDFTSTSKTISEGSLFTIDATDECIISEELALYNEISLSDSITLVNPNNEDDSFTLKVVGIYTSGDSDSMGMQRSDPANQIYTSYAACENITSLSSEHDEALSLMSSGTYVFANVEDYENFESQARDLGLDDQYTISSHDVSAYEQSLTPLTNLASYANTFLWIILVIGGTILVIFNIFRLRERKYEIGVLAAIGMNKLKIATQFMIELCIVTMIAIMVAIGLGSLTSVPIANSLLAQSETTSTMEEQMPNNMQDTPPSMNKDDAQKQMGQGNIDYISEISSATDFSVIIQLLVIGMVLTIVSGAISILFILRYEPLRILSDRE